MLVRVLSLLCAAVLVAACSDPPEPDKEPEGPSPEDALRAKWKKNLEDHAKRPFERPPLGEPVTEGKAADAYKPALGKQPEGKVDLSSAATVKAYVDDEKVKAVADAVVAGARAKDGKLDLGDNPLETIGRSDKTIIGLALALMTLDRQLEAATYVLAQIRMLDDVARNSGIATALRARDAQRALARMLTDIGAKLYPDELKEVVKQYNIILTSTPSIGLVLDNEIMSVAANVLADREFAGRELGLPVDKALNALEQHRKDAMLLDTFAQESIEKRIAAFEAKSCKIEGNEDRCKSMSPYIKQYAMAESDLRLTYVALAVMLYTREHGKPPVTTKAMETNVIQTVPIDPISAKYYDLVTADKVVELHREAPPNGIGNATYDLEIELPKLEKLKKRRGAKRGGK